MFKLAIFHDGLAKGLNPGVIFSYDRLSLIFRVKVLLNRTVVVDSDWRFDNLCHNTINWRDTKHFDSEDNYRRFLKRQSPSTTKVLFRTTFTRTIKLNLLIYTVSYHSQQTFAKFGRCLQFRYYWRHWWSINILWKITHDWRHTRQRNSNLAVLVE